jgi:hypothetical protein
MKETAEIIVTISAKNRVKRLRIQDVTILNIGRHNLFSLSQMLKRDRSIPEAMNIYSNQRGRS